MQTKENNPRINNSRIVTNKGRITTNIIRFIAISVLFVGISGLSNAAHAASLYFSPSTGSHMVDSVFSVSVLASSVDQAMNAVSGAVSFPQDKLEVVSLSKSGSAISLWVQEPSFFNSPASGSGIANFEGIVLNPGFTGSAGKIFTIGFKAKAAGSANLSFSSGLILANDGKATNILKGLGSANFTITAASSLPSAEKDAPSVLLKSKVPPLPQIYSSTHPDPEKWYQNINPEFNWKITPDITGVSIYLDGKSTTDPGSVSDGIFTAKTYKDLSDGVWYLHLKLENSFGWSSISHFKFNIDTRPPNAFEIGTKDGGKTIDRGPTINFEAKDIPSGIDYYQIKIGDQDWVEIREINYKIPPQSVGKHIIIVKAVDKAGNSTSAVNEVDILPIEPPKIIDYPKELILDSALRLSGVSLPEIALRVYIQKGDKIEKDQTKSGENGSWSYVYTKPLEKGIYSIWTEAIDEACAGSNSLGVYNNSTEDRIYNSAKAGDNNCAISRPSDKIAIIVSPPAFLKIGKMIIDYLSISLALLILVLAMIILLIWFWNTLRKKFKRLKKETSEAEKELSRAFKFLGKEVEKQAAKLDSSPQLSKKEKEISDNLKKAIKSAEKFIGKEIKDIEDELNK